ncbi:uncharacterized protein LOC132722291 [Ruditapes philippinarum]|uniref:uncharacterized protein LOC132722291 n=1 Tax=Ruditapes philippinarum TaxID=129788 RepID=UPI00295C2B55|nr:uncharacterized protein LOC132722291 [Ruditapes philippinarum]
MASDNELIDIDYKGPDTSSVSKVPASPRQEKESRNKKEFVCSHCKKVFSHKGNWVQHVRSHTKERPFTCNLCGMAYTKSSHLLQHRRTHKGITREDNKVTNQLYDCYVCNRSFTLLNSLKVHMRSHSDERTISCHLCDKKFRHKSTLMRHLKVHSGIKTHSCDLCQKRFYDGSDLKKHIRVHTQSNKDNKGRNRSNVIEKYFKKHISKTNEEMSEKSSLLQSFESVDELTDTNGIGNGSADITNDIKDEGSLVNEDNILNTNDDLNAADMDAVGNGSDDRLKDIKSEGSLVNEDSILNSYTNDGFNRDTLKTSNSQIKTEPGHSIEYVTERNVPHETGVSCTKRHAENVHTVGNEMEATLNIKQGDIQESDLIAKHYASDTDDTFEKDISMFENDTPISLHLNKTIAFPDCMKKLYYEDYLEIGDEIYKASDTDNNMSGNDLGRPTAQHESSTPTKQHEKVEGFMSDENKDVDAEGSAMKKVCDEPIIIDDDSGDNVDNLQNDQTGASVINEFTIERTDFENNHLLMKSYATDRKERVHSFTDRLNDIESFTLGIDCEIQLESKVVHAVVTDLSSDCEENVAHDFNVQNSKDMTFEVNNSNVSEKYKNVSPKELANLTKAYWDINKNSTIAELHKKMFKICRKMKKKGSSDKRCISKYVVIGPKILNSKNVSSYQEAIRRDEIYLGTRLNVQPRKRSAIVESDIVPTNKIFKRNDQSQNLDDSEHVQQNNDDNQSDKSEKPHNIEIEDDLSQMKKQSYMNCSKLQPDNTSLEETPLLQASKKLSSQPENTKLLPEETALVETPLHKSDKLSSSENAQLLLEKTPQEERPLLKSDKFSYYQRKQHYSSENAQLLLEKTPPEESPLLESDKLSSSENAKVLPEKTPQEKSPLLESDKLSSSENAKVLPEKTPQEESQLLKSDKLSSSENAKVLPEKTPQEESPLLESDKLSSSENAKVLPEKTPQEESLLLISDKLIFSENTIVVLWPQIPPPEKTPLLSTDKLPSSSGKTEVAPVAKLSNKNSMTNSHTEKTKKSNSQVNTCRHCQEVFNDRCSFLNHLRQHVKNKVYTCEDCNHSFDKWRDFSHHKCSKYEYICAHCDKVFHNEKILTCHMEKKKFPCSFCQKIACSLGKLHEHLITHYQFQCSTCSEKFKSRHALNVHGREDTCSSENQERKLTEENMQQMNESKVKTMIGKQSDEVNKEENVNIGAIDKDDEEVTNNGGTESFNICQNGEVVITSPEKSITTENTNDITDTVKQFSSSLAEWQNLVSAIREENSEANKKEIPKGVENHCAEIDADGDNSEGRSGIYKDNGNKKEISKDLEDDENQCAEIDASGDNSEEKKRKYEDDGDIADDKVTCETGYEKQNHCMTNRPDLGHDFVSDKNKKKSTISKFVQRKHRIKKDKFIVSNALFKKKNKGSKLAGWNKNFKSVTKKSVVEKKRLKENENEKDISGSVLTDKEKTDKMHKEKNSFKFRKNEKIKDNPEESTDKLEEKMDSFKYRKGQNNYNIVDINKNFGAIGDKASNNVNMKGAISPNMVGKDLDTVGYNSESDTNSGESGDDNSDGYTSVSGDINGETDLVSDNDSDGYEECTVEEIQAMLTGHNKQ